MTRLPAVVFAAPLYAPAVVPSPSSPIRLVDAAEQTGLTLLNLCGGESKDYSERRREMGTRGVAGKLGARSVQSSDWGDAIRAIQQGCGRAAAGTGQ